MIIINILYILEKGKGNPVSGVGAKMDTSADDEGGVGSAPPSQSTSQPTEGTEAQVETVKKSKVSQEKKKSRKARKKSKRVETAKDSEKTDPSPTCDEKSEEMEVISELALGSKLDDEEALTELQLWGSQSDGDTTDVATISGNSTRLSVAMEYMPTGVLVVKKFCFYIQYLCSEGRTNLSWSQLLLNFFVYNS